MHEPKYRQKIAIWAPSHNIVGLCPSQLRHVSTIGKNLLSSNVSATCRHNMVNFGILTAEIRWRVWGTPANFNTFRASSERQPNFAALNRGQGHHHVGHWPTFLAYFDQLTSICGFCQPQNVNVGSLICMKVYVV